MSHTPDPKPATPPPASSFVEWLRQMGAAAEMAAQAPSPTDDASLAHPSVIAAEFQEWCRRHGVVVGEDVFTQSLSLTLSNYAADALRVARQRIGVMAGEIRYISPQAGTTEAGGFVSPPAQNPGTPRDLPTAEIAAPASADAPALPPSDAADLVHEASFAPSDVDGSIGSGRSSTAQELGVNPAWNTPTC